MVYRLPSSQITRLQLGIHWRPMPIALFQEGTETYGSSHLLIWTLFSYNSNASPYVDTTTFLCYEDRIEDHSQQCALHLTKLLCRNWKLQVNSEYDCRKLYRLLTKIGMWGADYSSNEYNHNAGK